MSLSPRDMWQHWGHFSLTQIEGVLLASRGQRMLVNAVRCTGQLMICDAVEKPCCGLLVLATVSVISLIASLPISNSGFPVHRGLGNWLIKLASGTGWGPGPFAAVLQSLYLDTPLLEQWYTKKLYGTKNNSMHAQLGQILDPKDTKRSKNPTGHFWGAWSKKQGVRNKSRVLSMSPALSSTRGVGRISKPALWPDPWAQSYT